MRHNWSILCEKSSIDIGTNQLSIFNCIEEINLTINRIKDPKEPFRIPAIFEIISFWTIENSKKENKIMLKYDFVSPNNEILSSIEPTHKIPPGQLRFRDRNFIHGLTVTTAGKYLIKIYQKEIPSKTFDLVKEIPLDINISYKIATTKK